MRSNTLDPHVLCFSCYVIFSLHGPLKFWETIDLEVTFDIDLHKTRAEGKVHDLTTHVNVKYNGSVGTCRSFSGSREFTTEGPATVSVKYYVPRKFKPS